MPIFAWRSRLQVHHDYARRRVGPLAPLQERPSAPDLEDSEEARATGIEGCREAPWSAGCATEGDRAEIDSDEAGGHTETTSGGPAAAITLLQRVAVP